MAEAVLSNPNPTVYSTVYTASSATLDIGITGDIYGTTNHVLSNG